MPPLVAPAGLTIFRAWPEPPVGPAVKLGRAPPKVPVSVIAGVPDGSSKEISSVPAGVGAGVATTGVVPTMAVTVAVSDVARIVVFGFAGHTTTAALAAEDAAYCSALRGAKPDATVAWSGADPALVDDARRNDAVVAARREDDAALALLPAVVRTPTSLRDPCAP